MENLQSENEKLREELFNVKTRNKKLCGILLQGERIILIVFSYFAHTQYHLISVYLVKEKAQLLVEMEKMSKVKDELTAELECVTNQLSQERSKVTVLTDLKKTAVMVLLHNSLTCNFLTSFSFIQTYKKKSDNEK